MNLYHFLKKSLTLKLISRILLFGLLLIILDFSIGHVLEWMFFNQKKGIFYRATFGLENSTADVLIFGSSSANHHFVPEIISEGLKMTVYNQGRDSMEILYDYAMLKGILKRYTPKVIILNLTPSELSSVDNYDKLFTLLPYYKKHPEMRDIIMLRSKFEHVKLLSRIYPFNSTIITMIPGLLKKELNKPNLGYIPLYKEMDPYSKEIKTFKEEPILDTNRVKAFESFITLCKKKGIKLFIIFSPWFYVKTETTATINAATNLSQQYGIPVFNLILDTEFLGNAHLFMDEGHLNHEGASKFSIIIVERIRHFLKKNIN